jgi:D-alanyl-D-alanine carboxypeptidase
VKSVIGKQYTKNTITKEKQPIKNKKKQTIIVQKTIFFGNTNRYSGILNLWAAKTGYTSQAGRCITMLVNSTYRNVVIVVLNANSSFERTMLIDRLLDMYVYTDHYKQIEAVPREEEDNNIEIREETYDMLHPDL